MLTIHKRLIIDENGNPTEVVIPWDEYKEIEEILGLDLDETTIKDLQQARKDRVENNKDAYMDLDSLDV